MPVTNLLILLGEAVVYFVAMATLFRLRHPLGIGIFFSALGVLHFLETYLASVFYVELPFGIVVSPGSTVLFAGKLVMLLLVFVRENAATARQPIYGLFLGNLLILGFVIVLRSQAPVDLASNVDFTLLDQMGWLMAWGSTLLFLDSILIILLYQKAGDWFGRRQTLRIALSAAVVLTFDQAGFYLALRLLLDMPVSVLVGGWVTKMLMAAMYAGLAGLYLRHVERATAAADETRQIGDILDIPTYRRRYHELLANVAKDPLTGLLDRRRYDAIAPAALADELAAGRPISLVVIDIDHFKRVNDAFGHAAGDVALKEIARCLAENLREVDLLFRYGGEEFVILTPAIGHGGALVLAERLRRSVAARLVPGVGTITISAGVATAPEDAADLENLFLAADRRLYRAKGSGRNRVDGGRNLDAPSAAAPLRPPAPPIPPAHGQAAEPTPPPVRVPR